ncbi:patatin-like phospholipase family protein, partial [Actinoplanes sp. NPDC005259]|uniref:patatin-like phospholipase family protein n=1 Tax=Actinoplanes sp. NPDC005259 TaxID=3154674 RepID=UPI0033A28186
MEKRALVLGGGGVTGVVWEIGLLHGLAERGVDLAIADLLVGTSAGSVVAAQLTGEGRRRRALRARAGRRARQPQRRHRRAGAARLRAGLQRGPAAGRGGAPPGILGGNSHGA